MTPLAFIFSLPVRFYRLVFSPWVGRSCRYDPTCSAYALEALKKHGGLKGGWLTLKRLGGAILGAVWASMMFPTKARRTQAQ